MVDRDSFSKALELTLGRYTEPLSGKSSESVPEIMASLGSAPLVELVPTLPFPPCSRNSSLLCQLTSGMFFFFCPSHFHFLLLRTQRWHASPMLWRKLPNSARKLWLTCTPALLNNMDACHPWMSSTRFPDAEPLRHPEPYCLCSTPYAPYPKP